MAYNSNFTSPIGIQSFQLYQGEQPYFYDPENQPGMQQDEGSTAYSPYNPANMSQPLIAHPVGSLHPDTSYREPASIYRPQPSHNNPASIYRPQSSFNQGNAFYPNLPSQPVNNHFPSYVYPAVVNKASSAVEDQVYAAVESTKNIANGLLVPNNLKDPKDRLADARQKCTMIAKNIQAIERFCQAAKLQDSELNPILSLANKEFVIYQSLKDGAAKDLAIRTIKSAFTLLALIGVITLSLNFAVLFGSAAITFSILTRNDTSKRNITIIENVAISAALTKINSYGINHQARR